MKVLVLVALAIVCLVEAKTKWHQLEGYTFEKYAKEFGRSYKDSEIEERRNIFNERLESIKAHNRDTSKTWKEGVNQFTDRTEEERRNVLGLNKDLLYAQKAARESKRMSPIKIADDIEIPTNVDWRNAGIITAVKDQGDCGSCWTFGTAESIESYMALATPGNLIDISEQQILDCVPNPDQCGGTGGCQGGTPELAYVGLMQIGGAATEWTYPYQSYFGNAYPCRKNTTIRYARLSGFTTLTANSYNQVINHIATVGPLAINVEAMPWQHYEEGVFNGCNQTDPDIDHVVQLVGYGVDPQLGDYWLVRNSWSPTFGEDGYIRLARPSTTPCGWDTKPSDGTGCKGGPAKVYVCGTCGVLFDTSFPNIDPDTQ